MPYIPQPGDPQGRPPYLGQNVLMQGAFIHANQPRLQVLCDLVLNGVDPDTFSFKAVGDYVMYAALFAEKMRSADPRDSQSGYVAETDIGLWVLTWGGRKGEAYALRWLPAFIFVDSPSALMTGREVYGYPKHLGHVSRVASDPTDFGLSLSTVALKRRGDPDERAEEHELLRVEPARAGVDTVSSVMLDNLLSEVRSRVAATAPDLFNQPRANTQIAGLLPPFLGLPMVFLRQTRSISSADDVLLQSLATVTVRPTSIHGVGFGAAHRMALQPLASFPIADTLGTGAAPDLHWSFWARFDFEVGFGQEL